MSSGARGGGFGIVIPTMNRAGTIERSVRSVLDQGPLAREIHVVDDGGTDDTRAILESLDDDRVHYVRQEHGGVSAARNVGARAVSRQLWLTFLDSDDEALPGWLEGLHAEVMASRHDRLVAVFCGARVLTATGGVEHRLPHDLGPTHRGMIGLFLAGTYALRGDVLDRLGGFRAGLEFSENTDLALRLAEAAGPMGWRTAAVPVPLVQIHERAVRHPPEVRLAAAQMMLEEHADRFARDPAMAAAYRAIAGVAAARLGRASEARRWFWEAAKINPRDPRHVARGLLALSPRALRWRYRQS